MKLLPRPKKSFRAYLDQYMSEHTKLGTKVTHFVGIPMIVVSLPTTLVNPPLAGGLFAGGWALQLIGHAVFEKNKPSFFADPYYMLIGPAFVAIEAGQILGLLPRPLFVEEPRVEQPVATNGAAAAANL